jgi:hypothetical protein
MRLSPRLKNQKRAGSAPCEPDSCRESTVCSNRFANSVTSEVSYSHVQPT